jgi:hypothetical protein
MNDWRRRSRSGRDASKITLQNRQDGRSAEGLQERAARPCARNVAQTTIDWRFTTADARIKLKRLYPAILP